MPRKRPGKPAPPLPPPRESSRLYARIAPRHIAMFRFLLEAQDNLGYMTVLDRGLGGAGNRARSKSPGEAGDVGQAGAADAPGSDPGHAGSGHAGSDPGLPAVLKIVFSPHQERELRAFLDSMRAAIPFSLLEAGTPE